MSSSAIIEITPKYRSQCRKVSLLCQGENRHKNSLMVQAYLERRWNTFMYANFVNCWHQSDYESQAMWKIYAGSAFGVSIRSNIKRLQNCFANFGPDIYIGEISYIDFSAHATRYCNIVADCPYMYKRREFSYEREVRALISGERFLNVRDFNDDGSPAAPENRDYYEVEPKDRNLKGQSVPVDLVVLIEKLVIAPNSPPWFVEVVKSISQKLGYGFPIVPSEIS